MVSALGRPSVERLREVPKFWTARADRVWKGQGECGNLVKFNEIYKSAMASDMATEIFEGLGHGD